ncbi:MAG: hypothetical protein JWL85_717 [Candidatus Saccharibacteria bacterium]|nr:hypothetical protein [Candidatus Saccharibacteria bacterium]
MNKFDNNRNKKPRGAVDGFIGGGNSGSRNPVKKTQVYQPRTVASNTSLGNFGNTDGFHGKSSSNIKAGTHPLGRQSLRDGTTGQIALDMPAASARSKRGTQIKKPFWKNIGAKKAAIALLLVILIGGGFLFGNAYLKARQVLKGGGGAAALEGNVDPSKLRGEGDGRVNILMLGKGGAGHEGADLTDTLLIVSIDPVQKEAAILSIPRDFYVKTTDHGSMKINAVYAMAKNEVLSGKKTSDQKSRAEDAGFKAVEKTIEQTIGIPIHYHSMVDFEGFKKAIDTVGGVDINVTTAVSEQMRIDGRNYKLDVKTGQQHFDGFRALAYSRSRHTSARGDFDRSERQRAIMVALKDKTLSLGTLGNPMKINQLINEFGGHVQTNLSVDELLAVYGVMKQIDNSKIQSIGLADPPNILVTTTNLNGQSVVIPKAGLNNYKEIQNYIRNKLRDGYLANENASVAIYNGTYTAGLAARTAEELKSYGYNVTTVADAPNKGYSATTIVDLRNGSKKYTRRYLEQRFKTSMTSNIPDTSIAAGSADFVIILGQNEVSRLED